MKLTPRERVERAMRAETVDQVPFTIYKSLLPWRCTAERELRNRGLCIVVRAAVLKGATPNVKTTRITFTGDDGEERIKTVYETPAGTLTRVDRPAPGTAWREELPFKSPEDYAPLIAWINDRRYEPDYEQFIKAREDGEADTYTMTGIGYSPLQEIIYMIMGIEPFAMEWAMNRDELMKLYDALTEDRRRIYPIIADSPAQAVNYGGNVSPEIVGLERFEKYVVPHYDEACEIMGKKGKLVGVHMDANNKLFADALAASKIDYVEAFTPPPDCDLSVAEARAVWPDKILWINFPSSVHLAPAERVKEATRAILAEAAPGEGFLIGVTEDIPEDCWRRSLGAIADVLEEEGRLPLKG